MAHRFHLLVVAVLDVAATAAAEEAKAKAQSRVLPAAESLVLNVGIWGGAKALNLGADYDIRVPDNFARTFQDWKWDHDDFDTNQFEHPYHGALSMLAARGSGLGFWEAALYPVLTSLVWELWLETLPPSPNDQLVTGFAGVVFGEALYRLSLLAWGDGGAAAPVWRKLIAAVIAPFAAINRWLSGDAFAIDVAPSSAWLAQVSVGAGWAAAESTAAAATAGPRAGASIEVEQRGVNGWRSHRPFDHFSFRIDFQAGEGRPLPPSGPRSTGWDLFVRGDLVSTPFTLGPAAGLVGLFAGYDYDEPSVYRLSTAQLGLGGAGEARLAEGVVVQGIAVAHWVGFANASSVSAPARPSTDSVYHLGANGQLLVDARLIVADRVLVRAVLRETAVGASVAGGRGGAFDLFTHASGTVLVRILGPHAVQVRGEWAARHAPDDVDRDQRRLTAELAYCFISDERLGAGVH